MKIKKQLTTYLFVALTMVFAMSCGEATNSNSEEEHEHAEGMEHDDSANTDTEEAGHEHAEADSHDMDHGDEKMGEGFTWTPSEESMAMMEYKTNNITLATSGDEDVLMFEPAGQRASCMFKDMHSNVGLTATIKMEDAKGSVKLIHHSTGRDNYEFVWLEGGVMKLGRVENGEEKIFDSKKIEIPNDWFTLTVTAAGSHYKGYLNDKMITHGHGDVMKPGLLGIVASGNGTVSVKKVEATPLEEEH